MVLTVNKVLEQMRHQLGGGDLSTELDKFAVLNEAGEHLYSMYPWHWAAGRSALIDLRGNVTGTTATWTASTKTLTQSSGFTSYTFVAGDEVQIIDGTGATTGVYKIASRTSANAIVLESSMAASNETTGDIEWAIYPGTLALPSDLGEIISIQSSNTANAYQVCLTSLDQVNYYRGANALTTSPALFYAALVWSGTTPTPVLEVWPSPSAAATGALRIFYRSRWTRVSTDTAQIEIPEFVESLYIWLARAFAAGYERNEQASIHQRLAEIQAGPVFDAAKKADGRVQTKFQHIRNGGATIHRKRNRGDDGRWLVNRVGAPI